MEDLQNKIIRTPLEPNITYSDDPLRMMRAVRFATQLDFSLKRTLYKPSKIMQRESTLFPKNALLMNSIKLF